MTPESTGVIKRLRIYCIISLPTGYHIRCFLLSAVLARTVGLLIRAFGCQANFSGLPLRAACNAVSPLPPPSLCCGALRIKSRDGQSPTASPRGSTCVGSPDAQHLPGRHGGTEKIALGLIVPCLM